MKHPTLLCRNILLLLLVLLCQVAGAQLVIRGTVYDKQARYGVQHVSVLSSSGIGTTTDSLGHYSIRVPNEDSIYFSYLGKATSKFLVSKLPPDQPLDISLPVSIDMLPSVTVRQPSYRMDSIANREAYKKAFEFDGGGSFSDHSNGGFGIGIGFDMLFNAKKYKRMERFKARLEREEREKYVDHRFTKGLVRRITGLTSPALDSFMVQYRPTYETIKSFETDYEYYKYIKTFSEYFRAQWLRDHPGVLTDSTVVGQP